MRKFLFAAVIAIVIFLKFNIDFIVKFMPPCIYYSNFGIYCTGCGNTRAVRALLKGDMFLSLRCNPSIVFLSLIFILYMLEPLVHKNLMPRSIKFWALAVSIFLIYAILRNFIPALQISEF